MRILKCALLTGFVLLSVSCATTDIRGKVDSALYDGRYGESVSILESGKDETYSGKDTILYLLDKGMLAHYAGDYRESGKLLENAGRAMEDAWTKSITQQAASLLVNDTAKDYAGEDYEDIYLNAFDALNYYHQNNLEDALVEIRRMNEKLQQLSVKYTALEERIADQGDNSALPAAGTIGTFANSALARYLGMLFYRAAGSPDDARIDHDWLQTAFRTAPDIYPFPVPPSIPEELTLPPGAARLNVVGFAGMSPVKKESVTVLPLPNGHHLKIALPEMVRRPSRVNAVRLVFRDGQTVELGLLEDMQAVAEETFRAKIHLITVKTIVRTTVKSGVSAGLTAVGKESDDENLGLALQIFGALGQLFADATERADLRLSRYFPGKAYVGGVTVNPGVYSFRVDYLDSGGGIVASFDYTDISVKPGKLNLIESLCPK